MSARGGLPRDALAGVPSVPECVLDPALVARLPAASPPPPWDLRFDAVLWAQRATATGRALLPAGLRPALPLGVAGFLHYHASPVGSYDELAASPTLVRGGAWRLHVPLMVVDSLASLHAGRAYWALPKAPATFTGQPAHGGTVVASAGGWEVRATISATGPAVPSRVRVSMGQAWPDGSVRAFPATVRGRARLARVRVEVAGDPSFARWLRRGHHPAILLEQARMRLRPPAATGA